MSEPDSNEPNGDEPAAAAPHPLAGLGLGSQFNPFAAGAYEWRRVQVLATLPGMLVPQRVNVYLCVWSDSNGRHAMNLIGDDNMREFIRLAQLQLSGLVLPPGN